MRRAASAQRSALAIFPTMKHAGFAMRLKKAWCKALTAWEHVELHKRVEQFQPVVIQFGWEHHRIMVFERYRLTRNRADITALDTLSPNARSHHAPEPSQRSLAECCRDKRC